MSIEEIIGRLKNMEDPYLLDPHIADNGCPEMIMAQYITDLREDIEKDFL